jgi:hypothetical protein
MGAWHDESCHRCSSCAVRGAWLDRLLGRSPGIAPVSRVGGGVVRPGRPMVPTPAALVEVVNGRRHSSSPRIFPRRPADRSLDGTASGSLEGTLALWAVLAAAPVQAADFKVFVTKDSLGPDRSGQFRVVLSIKNNADRAYANSGSDQSSRGRRSTYGNRTDSRCCRRWCRADIDAGVACAGKLTCIRFEAGTR